MTYIVQLPNLQTCKTVKDLLFMFTTLDAVPFYLFKQYLESNSSWPDELMGPLNPTNKKFPLPGNVGVVQQHKLSTKSRLVNLS